MAGWLENAAGNGGPVLALIYLELLVGLALLASVLHPRRLKETREEMPAVRLYFRSFFGLLLAAPVLTVTLAAGEPMRVLKSFGWTLGRSGLGAALVLAGLPLAVLAGSIASRDPDMRKMYPFAKAACAGAGCFVRYELSYLALYYLPWESVFRGALFFPLVPAVGLVPALAVQTIVSTLLHIGHPDAEIFAAAGAGLAFGLVAYFTGSFLYPLVLHAATGMATDAFLYARRRRERPA